MSVRVMDITALTLLSTPQISVTFYGCGNAEEGNLEHNALAYSVWKIISVFIDSQENA